METFKETLDPNESKDFYYDVSPALPANENIADVSVAFVDANGVSAPTVSYDAKLVRIRLQGGVAGTKSTFTLRVLGDATPPSDLEFGLAVNVVDSVSGPVGETAAQTLARYIAEAKAQRHAVMLGEVVIEVWRAGRKLTMKAVSLTELNNYISGMERELANLTATAEGRPRRRAIRLGWNN